MSELVSLLTQKKDVKNQINRRIELVEEIEATNHKRISAVTERITKENLNDEEAKSIYESITKMSNDEFQKWYTTTIKFLFKWFDKPEWMVEELNQDVNPSKEPLVQNEPHIDFINFLLSTNAKVLKAKQYLQDIINNIDEGLFFETEPKALTESVQVIEKLLRKFPHYVFNLMHSPHKSASLKEHDLVQTIKISNEYDVHHLLHPLLLSFFDNVQDEVSQAGLAGKGMRADFLIKDENIIIEVKCTSKGKTYQDLVGDLGEDMSLYVCDTLFFFIYDKENKISDPSVLENDIAGTEIVNKNVITVVVYPRF